jgi:hypothetical protein
MVYVPPGYEALVQKAATALGIPFAVVAAQIEQESGWNGSAVGKMGEQGLFQFMPGTWKQYGSGDFASGAKNPTQAVDAYISYMRYLLKTENGDMQAALAAYNAGPGNIQAGMGYAQKILQVAAVPGVQYQRSDNNGISLANSPMSPYIPQAAQPVLSIDMLRSEFPLVAALVSSVPELNSIYGNAVSGSWSTDRFIAAVQNSSWWATHSDTARQVFATMKTDPATYHQQVDNLQASLTAMASSLGANVTSQQIQALAVDALTGGYDTNQSVLRQKFAQYVQPVSGVHFGGDAGAYEDQIRQQMRDLGVFLPEDQLDRQIQQIVSGQQTVQGVSAQLRSQSASMYPAYSSQINSGMNLSDIAAPYISRAQQLLETGTGGVSIESPLIKSALQYSPGGVPTAMPLGDFEKQVRQDPRWLSTDNAQDSIMSNAHRVLVDMGFEY